MGIKVITFLKYGKATLRENDESMNGRVSVDFHDMTRTYFDDVEYEINLQKVEVDQKRNVVRVYYQIGKRTGRRYENGRLVVDEVQE